MTTHLTGLKCLNCDATYQPDRYFEGCPECRTDEFRSNLAPIYDYHALRDEITHETVRDRERGVWMLPELLPVSDAERVTLGEGGTPLLSYDDSEAEMGLDDLYVKDESQNPTWSYKDRLCSVALTHASESGADVVTISSTGNHGASTAAYAARGGMESVVFTIPEVPKTMKTLMQVYGANVLATPTPEDRWTIMRAAIDAYDWYPTSNYVAPPVGSNCYGIEGYKSIAYETILDLDWTVPDWVVVPTAYADGLSGIWRGFEDLRHLGLVDETPKMIAVEPFGPLKNALEKDLDHVEPVEAGDTVAFSIGAGISTYQGLDALKESGGTAVVLNDEDLVERQRRVGAATGVYAESSAVASVAGVSRLRNEGVIDSDDLVVTISTSTGLKDPDTTAEHLPTVPTIEPKMDKLRATLRGVYGVEV